MNGESVSDLNHFKLELIALLFTKVKAFRPLVSDEQTGTGVDRTFGSCGSGLYWNETVVQSPSQPRTLSRCLTYQVCGPPSSISGVGAESSLVNVASAQITDKPVAVDGMNN